MARSSIEIALLAEGAAQFKSAAARLESELELLRAQAEDATVGEREYEERWLRVEKLRHDLIIQREALRLTHHEDFLRIYALPPRRRTLPPPPVKPPPPVREAPRRSWWRRWW